MSKKEFSSYKEWKAEVKKRGLEQEAFADVENGPSVDDVHEPTFAVKYGPNYSKSNRDDKEEYGVYQYLGHEEAGGPEHVAVLFDTPDEFTKWHHEQNEDPKVQECVTFGLLRELKSKYDKGPEYKVGQELKIPEDLGGVGKFVKTGQRHGLNVVFLNVEGAEGLMAVERDVVDKLNDDSR
jgi:hypothetical protein